MEIAKKIFNIVLIILTAIMVFASCMFVYYSYWGKDKLPTGITSTYATTITDPQTGEVLPTLQANYYENKNGIGKKVVEFRINCYSGVAKRAIYARGFQLVYDDNGKATLYRYDSYDGKSFETGHEYTWGDKMYIDIDGTTYAVALDGTYKTYHKKLKGGKIARTIGILGLNLLFEDTNYYEEYTETHNYTFEDLLTKVASIIKSSSNGTGNGIISLIDLGDFLHVYELDDSGNPKGTPLGGGTSNTLINSYFTMQTHYDLRGMAWTKQSLFESVGYDSQYNITGVDGDVEYWKSTTVLNLTEQDFEARYSQIDSGFYYILPTSKINEIKNFENVEVNIDFNVSNFDVNVLGFDYYALYGIKVNSLKISSKTQRDFKLLVGSLKDTGLEKSKITTENINLINTNSGVEL